MANILIAEDEKAMQDTITEYMRKGGLTCFTADDGMDALLMIKNNPMEFDSPGCQDAAFLHIQSGQTHSRKCAAQNLDKILSGQRLWAGLVPRSLKRFIIPPKQHNGASKRIAKIYSVFCLFGREGLMSFRIWSEFFSKFRLKEKGTIYVAD